MTIRPGDNLIPTCARTYIRISVPRKSRSERRATAAVSLDTQMRDIERYAEAHNLVIVGRYEDEMTGRRSDRPGYRRLLSDLERGEVVLIWKVDRIGRNKLESFRLYDDIERRGVTLISVTEPDMSEELRDILTIAASWESRKNSERVRANMAFMAQRGDWLPRAPLWYAVGPDRRLRPAAGHERAQAVWEHFVGTRSLLSACRMSGLDIDRLRTMLRNPAYCGDTVWADVVVRDTHPAIVRRETWEAADAILASRATHVSRDRANAIMLPPHILHLAGTDDRLYHVRQGDRCRLYRTRTDGVTPYRSVRADDVEAWVVSQLRTVAIDEPQADTLRRRVVSARRDDPRRGVRERIAADLRRVGESRVRIGRAYGEGRMDDATYDTLRADLDRDEVRLRRELLAVGVPPDPQAAERAIALRKALREAVDTAWEARNAAALRPLVELFILRVDVDVAPHHVVGWNAHLDKPAPTFALQWNEAALVR